MITHSPGYIIRIGRAGTREKLKLAFFVILFYNRKSRIVYNTIRAFPGINPEDLFLAGVGMLIAKKTEIYHFR
ncbi:MAG: hypothetical protein WCP87_02185 [Atribacterota bacterium]